VTDGRGARAEYAIPQQVLHREVDGQMVLLDLASETYFGLDGVGADMIAQLLEQPVDAAVARLAERYEVDHEVVRRDVADLISELLAAGLLKPVSDA
jgi:hypothetical protein